MGGPRRRWASIAGAAGLGLAVVAGGVGFRDRGPRTEQLTVGVRGGALLTVAVDGTRTRAVRLGNALGVPGGWSPDGRTLAFTRQRLAPSPSAAVVLVGCDGRIRTIAAPTRIAGVPSFSPDGRRLAWVSVRDSHTLEVPMVVVADASGNRRRTLPSAGGNDLAWSPDGRFLASEWSERVRVVEVATGRVVVLAPRNARSPSWRRDGRLTWVENGRRIWLARPGERPRLLLTVPGGRNATGLGWSPDGTHLAYSEFSPVRGGPPSRIVVVDGSGRRRVLTRGRGDAAPRWSPSGRLVSFLRVVGGRGEVPFYRLMVARADGRGERVVPNVPDVFVLWVETGGYGWRPRDAC